VARVALCGLRSLRLLAPGLIGGAVEDVLMDEDVLLARERALWLLADALLADQPVHAAQLADLFGVLLPKGKGRQQRLATVIEHLRQCAAQYPPGPQRPQVVPRQLWRGQ